MALTDLQKAKGINSLLGIFTVVYLLWVFITYGLAIAEADRFKARNGDQDEDTETATRVFVGLGYVVGAAVAGVSIYAIANGDASAAASLGGSGAKYAARQAGRGVAYAGQRAQDAGRALQTRFQGGYTPGSSIASSVASTISPMFNY
jgi:hypothetical protein